MQETTSDLLGIGSNLAISQGNPSRAKQRGRTSFSGQAVLRSSRGGGGGPKLHEEKAVFKIFYSSLQR